MIDGRLNGQFLSERGRLRQAVLPVRLHGLRGERKALMAVAICAWWGENKADVITSSIMDFFLTYGNVLTRNRPLSKVRD